MIFSYLMFKTASKHVNMMRLAMYAEGLHAGCPFTSVPAFPLLTMARVAYNRLSSRQASYTTLQHVLQSSLLQQYMLHVLYWNRLEHFPLNIAGSEYQKLHAICAPFFYQCSWLLTVATQGLLVYVANWSSLHVRKVDVVYYNRP